MTRLLLVLVVLLSACGSVVEPACDGNADCLVEWKAGCTEIRAGNARYDIWEVPGWEHEWSCGWYRGSWQRVKLTWTIEQTEEGSCFTEPAVETGGCWR